MISDIVKGVESGIEALFNNRVGKVQPEEEIVQEPEIEAEEEEEAFEEAKETLLSPMDLSKKIAEKPVGGSLPVAVEQKQESLPTTKVFVKPIDLPQSTAPEVKPQPPVGSSSVPSEVKQQLPVGAPEQKIGPSEVPVVKIEPEKPQPVIVAQPLPEVTPIEQAPKKSNKPQLGKNFWREAVTDNPDGSLTIKYRVIIPTEDVHAPTAAKSGKVERKSRK